MEWIGGCWTSLNHVFISKFHPSLTPTSGCWYSTTLWHNPNAHVYHVFTYLYVRLTMWCEHLWTHVCNHTWCDVYDARLTTWCDVYGHMAWCKHLKHMLNESYDERDVQITELGRLVWEVDVLVRKAFVGISWRGHGLAYWWAFMGSWSDLNWKCRWLLWIVSFGGGF